MLLNHVCEFVSLDQLRAIFTYRIGLIKWLIMRSCGHILVCTCLWSKSNDCQLWLSRICDTNIFVNCFFSFQNKSDNFKWIEKNIRSDRLYSALKTRDTNKIVGGALIDLRNFMKKHNNKYDHITYDHAMSVTGWVSLALFRYCCIGQCCFLPFLPDYVAVHFLMNSCQSINQSINQLIN